MKKNIPWGCHGMRHIPGGWGGIPSHDTKCVGCGVTVTICRHYRLANLLVVEPGFSSVPPTHKINTPPMGRGYFLADMYSVAQFPIPQSINTGTLQGFFSFSSPSFLVPHTANPLVFWHFRHSKSQITTKITGNLIPRNRENSAFPHQHNRKIFFLTRNIFSYMFNDSWTNCE